MTEQPERMPGTFAWNELMTRDPDGARAFYAGLFGWAAQEMPMPDGDGVYVVFMAGEKPAGGMFRMSGPEFEGVPSHWTGYVTVADLAAAVAKVTGLGGTVLKPAFAVEGVGSFAIVADPGGGALGLAQWAM